MYRVSVDLVNLGLIIRYVILKLFQLLIRVGRMPAVIFEIKCPLDNVTMH